MNNKFAKLAAVAVMAMGMLGVEANAASFSINLGHGAYISVGEHCHHGKGKFMKHGKKHFNGKRHDVRRHDRRDEERFRRENRRHDRRDRRR